jgi:positive regulator of sigma E activity
MTNYIKYIWTTDLRKMTRKNRIIGYIFYLLPIILFLFLVYWTAKYVNETRIWVVFGFFMGWWYLRFIQVLEYGEKKLT